MRYRPDIDGLRAVAVALVVFYHAKLGVPGGFVGVDVFFVISGFLITSLIWNELQAGRFSLLSFYERRIRRIFPALLVVLAFSALAASLLYVADRYEDFSKSLIATSLFSSNIYFWRDFNGGYFAPPASQKPLLHTWSVAVEEQYYILFPLFLLLFRRVGKQVLCALIAAVLILSFTISVGMVLIRPIAAFYLAPARAWELMIGALLALCAPHTPRNAIARETLAVAGAGLIAYGAIAFTAETPFPGLNAAFPCVGAALLIYSGMGGATWTNQILATRPFVFIGLISYSLYLWHWPLLVFAPDWKVYAMTPYDPLWIVGLSFALAVLSWRFVEMPVRTRPGPITMPVLFSSAAVATVALIAFGMFGYVSGGWPGRIPAGAAEMASYANSRNPRSIECVSLPPTMKAPATACQYGANTEAKYALWGDSHANAIAPAISKVADAHGQSFKYFGTPGCPPVIGVDRVDAEYSTHLCSNYSQQVLDFLNDQPGIQTIILAARLALYVDGASRDFGPAEQNLTRLGLITDPDGRVVNASERKALFANALRNTVASLLRSGKTIVLVYPVPETGYLIPETLARWIMLGRNPDEFTRPLDDYRARQRFVFDVLDSLGPPQRLIRVYPHKRLCNDTVCFVSRNGKALYRDDDHLSLPGADFIAPLFEPVFGRETPR